MKFLITLFVINTIITAILHFFGYDTDFRIWLLQGTASDSIFIDMYIYELEISRMGIPTPDMVRNHIVPGGYTGTFIGLTYISFITLLITFLMHHVTRIYLMRYWKHIDNVRPDTLLPNANGLTNTPHGISLNVGFVIPAGGIPTIATELFPASREIKKRSTKLVKSNASLFSTGERQATDMYLFKNQMPAGFVRLDKSNLSLNKQDPLSPLDKVYLAGVSILHKHKDWPADIKSHHAGAKLYEHATKVAKNLHKISKQHPCAPVIGIFHDIGKILAYQKKGSKFVRATKLHDPLSVYIFQNIPEYKELNKADASLIEDVLMYSHKDYTPARRNKDEIFHMLCKNLKFADGSAVQGEISEASNRYSDSDRFETLTSVVWQAVINLNINDYQFTGRSDGFASEMHDVIFVPITNLIRRMNDFATEEMKQDLMLDVEYAKSKARDGSPIFKTLEYLNLLNTSYSDIESESGFYIFKSGRVQFKNAVLLNKKEIFDKNPELQKEWDESQYPLTLVGIC